MASAAGFKQQCPSCEALVPIRDPDLIGRKIDCPKCKYRFVVEDPAGADADEAPKSKKGPDKNAKKPVKAKGKRRPDDEDDDDRSSSSKGGGSNKLLIGGLVGGVALIALAITAYFLLSDDSSTPKAGSSVASTPAPKPSVPDEEEKKTAVEEKPAAVASADMITNLLPPDTEGVCAVRLNSFVQNPVGHAIFGAPGTFLVGGLQRNLGFSPADVDLLLQGWNFSSNWTINILHSTKPFDKNAIIAALKLKPADAKIQDQEYFVADNNPWLDALGRAAFARLVQTSPTRLTVRSGKLGARFYDDQTLVLADLVPLQTFLNAKGSFEYRKAAKPEEKKEEKEAETPAGGNDGKVGRPNKQLGLVSSGMSMGGEGAAGAQGANKPDAKPAEPETKESASYMTIAPNLKAMLDRLDTKKPMLSLAVESEPAKGRVAALSSDPVGFDVVIKEAQIVGAAILWKDHLTFLMEGDFGSEDGAKRRLRDLDKTSGKKLAENLGKRLGTTVELPDEAETSDPFGAGGAGAFPGLGGRGNMPGGGPPPSMGGGRGRRGAEDEGNGRPGSGGPAGRPGRGGNVTGGMTAPGFGPPGAGGTAGFGAGLGGFGAPNPNAAPEPPKEPAKATARFHIQDRTVVLMTLDLIDSDVYSHLLNKLLRPTMIQEKGTLDMAGGRSRVHELAAATQKTAEQMQRTFPRGTLERPLPSSRAGRPYSPDQRISWLAELLPYMGHGALHAQLNRAQSWRDADNIGAASTLIPQFLNANTAPESWWVKYPGISDPVAATQFVGIAGVGLDAASYAAGDPAVADKIGIVGYDRQTAIRDITDGASNTMLMAQVPPTVSRPWLAGGGSTTVGVPEKNSVKPFVSVQGNGKKGTLVVMADGSVRFVSENVSDEVFKALATIKGNESVILNREAPKVEPPADEAGEVVLASSPAAPPAAPPVAESPSSPPEDPQQGGKVTESKAGKYKVAFPAGKRQEQKTSQDTPIGKIEIAMTSVDLKDGQSVMIMYNDFPPTFPFDLETALDNEAFMGAMRSQLTAQAPGSKIAGEKKVKVDGKDALELMIDVPGKGIVRDTFFFSGKRQYQILVTGPKAFVEGKVANDFVDSFKFTK